MRLGTDFANDVYRYLSAAVVLRPKAIGKCVFSTFFRDTFDSDFARDYDHIFIANMLRLFDSDFFCDEDDCRGFEAIQYGCLYMGIAQNAVCRRTDYTRLLRLTTYTNHAASADEFLVRDIALLLLDLFNARSFINMAGALTFMELEAAMNTRVHYGLTSRLLVDTFRRSFDLDQAFDDSAHERLVIGEVERARERIGRVTFGHYAMACAGRLRLLDRTFNGASGR